MPPEDKHRLNACLADYHRRIGLGEQVDPARYQAELDDLYPEFQRLLVEGAMIDDARRSPEKDALPRAFGGYTLLRELGRGASGVVYEAVHRELGRRVALKILRTGFDTHVTARERFRREARACAQIRHDHVVEIYEAGVEDDRPFYAMRLLEGQSLADSITSSNLPDIRTLCGELADVAGAMHVLHEAGIVHRDIKPSNLMVQPSGRFILADFGLARTADAASLTQTGDALGTPLYMSPEQMLGKREEIDGRTDIYGLGATLYQAVTGTTPFDTRDLGRLLKMVLTERPQLPRKLNPSVPKECEQIIMKCLEKRPEDRYATAKELEDDLRAFARGDQVAGKPISAARHGFRRLITSPLGIAAVVLGIAAGVLLSMQLIGPDNPAIDATSMPQSVVWVRQDSDPDADFTVLGSTTLEEKEVPEGPLTIEFRPATDDYATMVRTWDAVAGKVKSFEVTLPPKTWADKPQFDEFVKGLKLERVKIEKQSRDRSALKDSEDPILIFPRGAVRRGRLDAEGQLQAGGLDWLRVDIPELFNVHKDGRLVFEIDGEDVATLPFPDPEDSYQVDLQIPAEVARAALEGTRGSWRYMRGKREVSRATFDLVDLDLSRVEQLIDAKIGHHESARAVRSVVLGEMYLSHRLYGAALRATLGMVDAKQRDLRVYVIARAALNGLFAGQPELAELSPLYDTLKGEIQMDSQWSDAERAAAFDKKDG